MALASPFLLLLLLEVALRGLGIGYPTGFFLPATIRGRAVFIENQSFARRYFPPGLERAPLNMAFAAHKPADTVRIFVFGESAALGDPEPAYGFARVLETMLRETVPAKRIEVINVALTAINSHVIRDIAHDCAPRQGDYWIVYMGNNEVVGPFGAGTVFGPQVPAPALIRASLALKRTRVGQWLDTLRWQLAPGTPVPSSWDGMEMFLPHQVPSEDPRLARVYANFEANLREIIDTGRRAGAKVLVATVAVNLKDNAPLGAVHRAGLTAGALAEWERAFAGARTALSASNAPAALAELGRAAALDDRHAGLHYLTGRAWLQLGRTKDARAALEAALELDTLRFRADAHINRIIRRMTDAAGSPGVELIDVAGHLGAQSQAGLPGEEFFHEHVHFNFAGNYEVARLFARRVRSDLMATNAPELTPERCAALLACTDFDRYRVLDEVRQRLERAPFNRQLDHELRAARLQGLLHPLRSGSLLAALDVYRSAIAARPDDAVLRVSFGTLLRDFEQLPEALEQWRRAIELQPHSIEAGLGLANTLEALGRTAEAAALYFDVGTALARAGRHEEAVGQFEITLRLRPDHARAARFLKQSRSRAPSGVR